MAGLRVHFVFPAGLVERVDAALTVGQSRGEFVRAAVEQALGNRQDDSEQRDLGVRLPAPAPAEQFPTAKWPPSSYNYRHGPGPARSSVQAKRDVRPVPKAKP